MRSVLSLALDQFCQQFQILFLFLALTRILTTFNLTSTIGTAAAGVLADRPMAALEKNMTSSSSPRRVGTLP